jgi:transcriptional regulator with XRE-family HTH domain
MITRIRELLEARQLSPTQFADLIGVGRPVISHILSERNKPSLEVVQKIIGAFPDISLPWLLAGTGPMLATAAAEPLITPLPTIEAAQPPTPVIPIAAAAAMPLTPPAAPTARLAAPTPTVAASQFSSYPQPPKFRPGAVAGASPASIQAPSLAIEAPVSAADTSAAVPTLPSPSPVLTSAVATPAAGPALIAPTPAPLPVSPLSTTLPVANESLETEASPTAPAEVSGPPASSEVASSNPAAALSFLGEPGKAIRRIVIFYRDGSFSDYLPEGN